MNTKSILKLCHFLCRLKGYPIPVYEMGTGACSGAPYNTSGLFPTVIFETTEPEVPLKTTHEWRLDLRQDGLVLTAFIIGIISGEHERILMFCVPTCCILENAVLQPLASLPSAAHQALVMLTCLHTFARLQIGCMRSADSRSSE